MSTNLSFVREFNEQGILEGPLRMCGHRFGGARLPYVTPIADKLHLCPIKLWIYGLFFLSSLWCSNT